MTDVPRDGGRFLPAIPEKIAPLDPSVHGLAHVGPAGGRFLVEGRHAHVTGAQSEPGGVVAFPGVGTVSVTVPGGGRAANVVLFPGLVRRDFAGREGITVETLLVTPDLPLVAVWWAGAPIHDAITVEVAVEGRPSGGRDAGASINGSVERAPGGFALHVEGTGLAVGVAPPPAAVRIVESRPGCVCATITPTAAEVTALVVAGGGREGVSKAFAATAHLSGHARRAAAGPVEGGLEVDTGIDEIDHGVAWARARLTGLLDRPGPTPSGGRSGVRDRRALLLGLAASGVGDRASSARATSIVESWRGNDDSHPSAMEATLAARHALVFGDTSRASRIARVWAARASADRPEDPRQSADERELRPFAGRALADAVLHAVPDDMLPELRRPFPKRAGTSRSLPMVGTTSPEAAWAAWIEGLLAGKPRHPVPLGPSPDIASLRRATASFAVDPDAAWGEWRRSLGAGLAFGPAGPATWDDEADDGVDGSRTAEILLALVHGLLGLAHDAPAGRLAMAPRLPTHVNTFTVSGITLGDASLRLGYERSGQNHVFTLDPELAAVPPLIVFEPAVAGRVVGIRIDEALADLDVHRVEGLSLVPVQLPLDGPRRVEITTG